MTHYRSTPAVLHHLSPPAHELCHWFGILTYEMLLNLLNSPLINFWSRKAIWCCDIHSNEWKYNSYCIWRWLGKAQMFTVVIWQSTNAGTCDRLRHTEPHLGGAWQPFLFRSTDPGQVLFPGTGSLLPAGFGIDCVDIFKNIRWQESCNSRPLACELKRVDVTSYMWCVL